MNHFSSNKFSSPPSGRLSSAIGSARLDRAAFGPARYHRQRRFERNIRAACSAAAICFHRDRLPFRFSDVAPVAGGIAENEQCTRFAGRGRCGRRIIDMPQVTCGHWGSTSKEAWQCWSVIRCASSPVGSIAAMSAFGGKADIGATLPNVRL